MARAVDIAAISPRRRSIARRARHGRVCTHAMPSPGLEQAAGTGTGTVGGGLVVRADNLDVLGRIPEGTVDLVYVDPPFNTGRRQTRDVLRTVRDEGGDRTGFGGHRYRTTRIGSRSFEDAFDDYLAFLEPRIVEARRVL